MKRYFEKFGHTCDLKVEDEFGDTQGRVERVRKAIIKWSTIDPLSNLTLQHFNSHSNIMNEMKLHLEKYPYTIHPFSRIKFLWECVMASVFLIGLLCSPLQYLSYTEVSVETSTRNFSTMESVKTVFLVDMIVRFFTGYWDQEDFVVSKKLSL